MKHLFMLKVADKLPTKEQLRGEDVKLEVIDVQKAPNGQNLHQ